MDIKGIEVDNENDETKWLKSIKDNIPNKLEEKELNLYKELLGHTSQDIDTLGNHCISTSIGFVHLEAQELIDWLNNKHFNWRGLPENLYIRVTKENNPY